MIFNALSPRSNKFLLLNIVILSSLKLSSRRIRFFSTTINKDSASQARPLVSPVQAYYPQIKTHMEIYFFWLYKIKQLEV